MPTKRNSKSSKKSQASYPQMGAGFPQNPQLQGAAAYSRDSGNYSVAAQKKMSTGKKVLIAVVSVILALLLGGGTAFALYVNHLNDTLRGNLDEDEMLAINDALASSYGTSLNDVFYMMLLGTDTRAADKGDKGRSDTNIVVRVDPKQKIVSMISIPRDTKIDIPGHGTQKFNAAYAFGGAAGAIEAAEELLDVEIAHYAEVNFGDLIYLVNAVGGITVENESRIANKNTIDGNGVYYVIEEGTVHLDGGEALAFARNRDYPDGDFTRQKHQRAVIEAIVDAVLTAPLTSMPSIIEAAVGCVTTDLTALDIIGLAQNFATTGGELVYYTGMLPSYTQNINGISFVINDEEKTKEMVKLFKEGVEFSDIKSTMSAPDITTKDIDTSNVLLYDDDEEVINNKVPSTAGNTTGSSGTTNSSGNTTTNSGGNTSGNESSGGSTNTGSSGGSSGESGGSSGESGGGSDSGGASGGGETAAAAA